MFLKKKEQFISLVLKHLGTSALMDLLLRLVSCVEPATLRQGVLHVSVPWYTGYQAEAGPRCGGERAGGWFSALMRRHLRGSPGQIMPNHLEQQPRPLSGDR